MASDSITKSLGKLGLASDANPASHSKGRSAWQWLVPVLFAAMVDSAVTPLLANPADRTSHMHFAISASLVSVLGALAWWQAMLTPAGRNHRSKHMLTICGAVVVTAAAAMMRCQSPLEGTAAMIVIHGALLFGSYEVFSSYAQKSPAKVVAILGSDATANRIATYIEQNPQLGYQVRGFIDRRSAPRDGLSLVTKYPLLGTTADFKSICRRNFIDEVFVTLSSPRELLMSMIALGRESHVAVRLVPDYLPGDLDLGVEPSFMGEFPTLSVDRTSRPAAVWFIKRTLDLLVSSATLVVLAPIIGLIALLIKFDSEGPILYRSTRIGRKGKSFGCLKFRTMVADADERKAGLEQRNQRDSILFKIENDPRITKIGRWLRKYSLDELPQLINVLRGEMSLVGPRPCLPSEVTRYDTDALRRLEATPGVTGLWQVQARRDPSFSTYLSLDLRYIDGWSLWMDLKILASTVRVVLAGTGQ